MKRNLYLIIIFTILFVPMGINAKTYTRAQLQDYVVSTALSYYYNQTSTDYEGFVEEDSKSLYPVDYTLSPEDISRSRIMTTQCDAFVTSVYMYTFGYDFSKYHEYLSGYSENYFGTSYRNADGTIVVGRDSESNMKTLLTYFSKTISVGFHNKIAWKEKEKNNPIVIATYQKGRLSTFNSITTFNKYISLIDMADPTTNPNPDDFMTEEEQGYLIEEFFSLLQPGDIIINSGHAMIWVGDILGDENGGIIHSTGSSFQFPNDKYPNGLSGYDDYSVRYSSKNFIINNHIKGHGTDLNSALTILRPLNEYCGTGDSCELNEVDSNVVARSKLKRLKVEQFLYNDTDKDVLGASNASINKEDIYSYRLYFINESKISQCFDGTTSCSTDDIINLEKESVNYNVKITGTIPENTELVSCYPDNCTVSGNKVIWDNVTVDTTAKDDDTAVKYYFKVTPTANNVTIVNDGMTVEYDHTTLELGQFKTRVNNSVTGEYRKKLKNNIDADWTKQKNGQLDSYDSTIDYIADLYDRFYVNNSNVDSATLKRLLNANTIVNAIFKRNTEAGTNYYERKDSAAVNALSGDDKRINKMLVPNYYGGKKYEQLYHEGNMDYYFRTRTLWSSRLNFDYGDIIVAINESSDGYNITNIMLYAGKESFTPVYVYIKDGDLIKHIGTRTSSDIGSSVSVAANRYLLDTLHSSDLYVVLRPSQNYKPIIMSTMLLDSNGGEWTADTCTGQALFNSANHTCSMNVEYRTTYGELPIPERVGYDFDGWVYIDGNREIEIESNTEVDYTSDFQVQARWVARGGSETPTDPTTETGTGSDPIKVDNTSSTKSIILTIVAIVLIGTGTCIISKQIFMV